jgi:hypothetical protein
MAPTISTYVSTARLMALLESGGRRQTSSLCAPVQVR